MLRSCSVCDAQIILYPREVKLVPGMNRVPFVPRAMWKQGRNIVPTLRYFAFLWSFMLIIRSQLCYSISNTALTLCLCSLQITSQLSCSEVACYSFKNKILTRRKKSLKKPSFDSEEVVQCLIPLPAVYQFQHVCLRKWRHFCNPLVAVGPSPCVKPLLTTGVSPTLCVPQPFRPPLQPNCGFLAGVWALLYLDNNSKKRPEPC